MLGIIAFIIWELKTPHPAVNLRILKNPSFSAGSMYGMIVGLGLFGGIFILPVFLQNLRHYTAMQTGIIMLPSAIATAIAMPVVGRLSSRFPARNLVAIGAVGVIVSSYMLRTMTLDYGPDQIFWPLVIRGASMGFLFVPLTLATLVGLKGREIGDGTGLFNLFRQLGGSIGIAILSTFVDHRQTFHRVMLNERLSVYNPTALARLQTITRFFQSKGAPYTTARGQTLTIMGLTIQGQAAVMAFCDAFILIAFIFLAAMPLLLLMRKGIPGAAMKLDRQQSEER